MQRWARGLAPALLGLLAFAATLAPPAAVGPGKVVRPFLVYYGGVPDPANQQAARALARRMAGYPVVVLGLAAHDPAFARRVRRLAPRTAFYGYDDTGHVTFAKVFGLLRLFRSLHFQGALLDDIGTGLSTRPGALARIVRTAHRDGLRVLLNAWNPQDVLNLPLWPGRDAILCENWVYSSGRLAQPRAPATYAALRSLERRGILVFMIATTGGTPSPAHLPVLGLGATARTVFGDYLALSDPVYSADNDAILPAAALRRLLRSLSF